MESVRLDEMTVLITGANTGIGKETARELAKRGARVIMACRNLDRAEVARQEIISTTNNPNVVVKQLDLASLQSVRAFAEDYIRTESRLDILVNNAGVVTSERRLTEDGFEMHFGTNHLGHFLLTYLLLDKLIASRPSRVVVVSSLAHEYTKFHFDDPQYERMWISMAAYGRSKTANILFATHLAKLLEGRGVTVYSLHPGAIRTELSREYEGSCLFMCLGYLFVCFNGKLLTPEEGAQTTLYCCLEPSIAEHTGRYYSESREKRPKSYARDEELAKRLWTLSAELCAVDKTHSAL